MKNMIDQWEKYWSLLISGILRKNYSQKNVQQFHESYDGMKQSLNKNFKGILKLVKSCQNSMARKTEISLRSFYIFNSNLGQKEGEESKKILFYHPSEIDMDTKIKDIGLSEAIIKFTGTFTSEDDCRALHTQKTTQIFNQPEKDFWMVMTINVPYEIKEDNDAVEYKGGEVHNTIFRSVLKQTYQMFRLFAGSFQNNFAGENHDDKISNLKKRLETFYSKYLLTLKLPLCDVVDVVRSIQYLPLQKFLFLRVHSFINMIEATFPMIENCVFLYNDQLVWSEVNPTDLYSIHEYLITTLFPKAIQCELQGGSMRGFSLECNHYGSFVTGPENEERGCTKAPKVHIYNAGECSCYYLVVYRALNATMCLFIDAKNPINDDFYAELHSFMGPQLTSIASEIGETFAKSSPHNSKLQPEADNPGPKFLYINELSLRHTETIYLAHRHPKSSLVPPMVMNLIADLYYEPQPNSQGKFEEIVLKAVNDFWIVKKTSNWRQVFVIIHNNKATMLEITNEAKKVLEQQMTNVFFEK